MERRKVEELKERVNCAAVLVAADFAIDKRESTRRAVKLRRGDEIIIVIHEGKGWFDPLSDAKGDIFGLIEHLHGVPFTAALDEVSRLAGIMPTEPEWNPAPRRRLSDTTITQRWQRRRSPWAGSATWQYLYEERCIPESIIKTAVRQNLLREGLYGSMWAAHTDDLGVVTGWEERGPQWRGFSTGGAKVLFRFGNIEALRLCVTEAAIDAMSLCALEGLRSDNLYLSAGGGWSPATGLAIRKLVAREGMSLIAATDNDAQGDIYANRLAMIAGEAGCAIERLRPGLGDWNEDLRSQLRAKSRSGPMS